MTHQVVGFVDGESDVAADSGEVAGRGHGGVARVAAAVTRLGRVETAGYAKRRSVMCLLVTLIMQWSAVKCCGNNRST